LRYASDHSRGETLDIRRLARTAPAVPDNADAIDVLETLRKAEVPMAFVLDEYGHFEGLVTPTDLTGAIVGDFRSDTDPGDEAAAVERDDGSWLLAGWMPRMRWRSGCTSPCLPSAATRRWLASFSMR
jgi:putative hemolysin